MPPSASGRPAGFQPANRSSTLRGGTKCYRKEKLMPEKCRRCPKIQQEGAIACEKCPLGDNKK